MQLLLSHRRQGLTLGTILSVIIHAALLGLILLAYRSRPAEGDQVPDQWVLFMVPPDRPRAQEGVAAHWQPEPAGGAEEGGTARAVEGGTGPLVAGAAEAGDTIAPEAPDPIAALLGDSVMTELEVDSTVRRDPLSAAPVYPPDLLERNVEGGVFIAYIVDSAGRVDTNSSWVLRSSHPEFTAAVKHALARMRFRPALLMGRPVRQLVQQSFVFRITPPRPVPRDTAIPPPGL